ncbi:MAG: helicase [Myxococcales bacterium]|nr:helicase [Myxococcales bacterium]
MSYLEDVFGEGGAFARAFPGYERREPQVRLAMAVDAAIANGGHLLAEGPCGTGKAFAYSVPAAYHARHSGRRVVIATANIALQEQLVVKDLPALQRALPWPFTFALLKGRNNYACWDRYYEAQARAELGELFGEEEACRRIVEWIKETKTGDVSELDFVPAPAVWSRFSIGAEDCKGQDCSSYGDCFSVRARRLAAEADIVVCNYHLLFAHLQVKSLTGQDIVLPEHDVLICDEGHRMAEVARDFLGYQVSFHVVRRVASALGDLRQKELAGKLREAGEAFFRRLADHARSPAYRVRLRRPGEVDAGPLPALLGSAESLLEAAALAAEDDPDRRATLRRAARQARQGRERIGDALELEDGNAVCFIELDDRGHARLCSKPIDVSGRLREELFGATRTVVVTSATLSTDSNFEFVRRELGLPEDADEVIVESPFDFPSQALLAIPEGLPEPNDPGFPKAAGEVIHSVVEALDGRTLGLFTSYRVLNAVAQYIAGNGRRVLKQGDMPRNRLVEAFKAQPGTVLLGTESFWTGIDVPGDALQAVVIDRLPFPTPDDPLMDAICERNPRWFADVSVPRAIIALKQGFGRLIRSRADRGAVVILDRRLADKSYGRRFLRSLPPALRTRDLGNIRLFLDEPQAAAEEASS